jgi:hypothetical protein
MKFFTGVLAFAAVILMTLSALLHMGLDAVAADLITLLV